MRYELDRSGRTWLAGRIAALILAVAGCTGPEARLEDETPKPLTKVTVAWAPYIAYAPLAIAKENGYFLDEGLDVELVEMKSYDGIVAVAQRKVDVVAAHLFAGLFNAIDREETIRIVADKGHVSSGCPAYTILVRSGLFDEGRIDEARLAGLKFDLRSSTIEAYIVSRLLEPAGLTLDDIVLTDLPGATAIEALRNGSLDVKTGSEPHQTMILDTGVARLWKPVNDVVPGLQYSMLLYGPSFLEDDRETGVKFMKGYLRGVRAYNEGKSERNVKIISDFTHLSPELTRRACWAAIHTDGHVNLDSVDDFISWTVASGLLRKPVERTTYWDSSFIKAANEALAQDQDRGQN